MLEIMFGAASPRLFRAGLSKAVTTPEKAGPPRTMGREKANFEGEGKKTLLAGKIIVLK